MFFHRTKRFFHEWVSTWYRLTPLIIIVLSSCHQEKMVEVNGADPVIGHYGRTETGKNQELVLISTASYAEFNFTGDSCIIYVQNGTPTNADYNFISIELDSQYHHRYKVDSNDIKSFTIKATDNGDHLLRIYKASESVNGAVLLTKAAAKKISPADHPIRKKIEFIGDSHTASFGCDTTIPCWSGKWYDQNNGYYSYGPIVARALNADFMVNAVSGIGMYRNWDTPEPIMPQVFDLTYLTPDSNQHWDFSRFTPDLVSICLGTNDFSDYNGEKHRALFDSSLYIKNYVDFIGTLYKHYPNTQVAVLTSCVVSGDKGKMFLACLESVRDKCKVIYPGKPDVQVFQLKVINPRGCDYHPDISDHKDIAAQLQPFFRNLLEK